MALAVALGLAAISGGCSASGDEPQRRSVSSPPKPAPSVAEAEQAIRRYARFNTGEPRSIQSCTSSEDGATTCAVEYANSCEVLAVMREAGKLTISQVGGICLYSHNVSTQTSPVP